MQDIHLIGAGRMFDGDGGGGGTDRRLRQTHIQNQALKCPRCDSSNTKFCYYNNYNLSQPRHFCKSCRRYWTKGGVLRNVPVGGGCRKSSKRSSSSKSSRVLEVSKPKSNNSNSSSESSSLTGTNNAAAVAAPAVDLAAGPSASATTPPSADGVSSSFDVLFGFGHTKYVFPHIRNQNFSSELMNVAVDGGGCFNEIGNFSPMMTSSPNNDPTALNLTTSYDVVSSYRMNQHHQPQQDEQEQYDHRHQFEQWQLSSEEAKLPDMADVASGYINPTAQIDQSSNLGSQPLSWQEQHQMFGLTSADDQVYWSQQQWSNADNPNPPHLYLP